MKIYIGADHRGFAHKEQLKKFLLEKKHTVIDCGATIYNANDDYPDIGFAVGEKVTKDKNTIGILLCGSGAGVCIAANKVHGIRATNLSDAESVGKSREHYGDNILCIGADSISIDDMDKLANIFITTIFTGKERYKRRIEKIKQYEETLCK